MPDHTTFIPDHHRLRQPGGAMENRVGMGGRLQPEQIAALEAQLPRLTAPKDALEAAYAMGVHRVLGLLRTGWEPA